MFLTIADAGKALRSGAVTSVELVAEAIKIADAHDEELGYYLQRLDDTALAAAEAADAAMAAGVDRGPLQGIPIGVKDIISTQEAETTAQSFILDRAWGREVGDASVVARLRQAGAIIMGKLSLNEFALGMPEQSAPFPVPLNPWDTTRWTGGSSSGSAGAVAAGFVLGSLGSDTGGSIRYPAALCGVSGLKATLGRVPKHGCVPLGYTFDSVGPLARSAEDIALMLQVMAGHDPRDPSSAHQAVDQFRRDFGASLDGVFIGVDMVPGNEDFFPGVGGVMATAVQVLESLGASITAIKLPLYEELITVMMNGMAAEAYAYHQQDLETRWDEYSPGTRTHVITGALLSAGDYVQIQRVRRAGQRRVGELFKKLDLIVTPTCSASAPELQNLTFEIALRPMHTQYWNAVGNPALSVPMGFASDGLPLGMQIVGRPFAEATVLAVGHAYQQQTLWHLRAPSFTRDYLTPGTVTSGESS